MRTLARSTGGGYVLVEDSADLGALMNDVLEELRTVLNVDMAVFCQLSRVLPPHRS